MVFLTPTLSKRRWRPSIQNRSIAWTLLSSRINNHPRPYDAAKVTAAEQWPKRGADCSLSPFTTDQITGTFGRTRRPASPEFSNCLVGPAARAHNGPNTGESSGCQLSGDTLLILLRSRDNSLRAQARVQMMLPDNGVLTFRSCEYAGLPLRSRSMHH